MSDTSVKITDTTAHTALDLQYKLHPTYPPLTKSEVLLYAMVNKDGTLQLLPDELAGIEVRPNGKIAKLHPYTIDTYGDMDEATLLGKINDDLKLAQKAEMEGSELFPKWIAINTDGYFVNISDHTKYDNVSIDTNTGPINVKNIQDLYNILPNPQFMYVNMFVGASRL
jgi:hypothetical protein